jgi:hypothetical protein
VPNSLDDPKDNRLTVISVSLLACVLQNILEKGLGHGVTTWLSGAHHLAISTTARQSDIETRWISANVTLANLVFGEVCWLLLRNPKRYQPATRCFLVLTMMGNIFTGTGCFLFSGVFSFGDWAAVIRGLQPRWLWQLGLAALGIVSDYASMRLLATALKPFRTDRNPSQRLRALCWIPYLSDGILPELGGLFHPLSPFYVMGSARPSTLGANAGLLSMPFRVREDHPNEDQFVAPISRSLARMTTATVLSLLFLFVLDRGLNWSR